MAGHDPRLSANASPGVGLLYDPRFLDHDTGPGHAERPDRLRAVVRHLKRTGMWDRVAHLPFKPAERSAILRVHDPAYIDRLEAACAAGQGTIDCDDSAICPRSASVAYLAAGAAVAGVEAVAGGAVDRAFALVRPPGHHAERDRSMGFCLFNNAAVAAEHWLAEHGARRVAIVDFDVHHGNATQHSFEDRADVLFVSIHQHPATCYPGTGHAHETGHGPGRGTTLNLPLMPGGGDDVYHDTMRDKVVPALRSFAPDALLVSAGFDASAEDPLAQMQVTTDGFHAIADSLRRFADETLDGKMVTLLEGGYDLDALSAGVAAYLEVILG
ncbi:MAG: histone deacetylase [Phycisphaeraceae bacterium]